MRRTIRNHEQVLNDMGTNWAFQQSVVNNALQALEEITLKMSKLSQQIEQAKAEGLDGFDADRYEIKKGGE